jgi:glycine betaine/proline transport system substrate-binding protein
MRSLTRIICTASVIAGLSAPGFALGAESCGKVHLTTGSWTSESAKTHTAAWILQQLGYETEVTKGSVPIMFQALASGDADVGTWGWLPDMREIMKPHMLEGKIDRITINMPNAKYTVAVPKYVYDAGVQSFSDLADHREKFGGKIYGIEAGNAGNGIIKSMIKNDVYGLADWELVPSSAAGMLATVKRHIERDEWVAFLGWSPHPMNIQFDLKYLSMGEEHEGDYWGPNKGSSQVYTWANQGYGWRCPNVGQFFENYKFTAQQQARLGLYVEEQDMGYIEAGQKLMKDNTDLVTQWLGSGGTFQTGPVMTRDGEREAVGVIRTALGD